MIKQGVKVGVYVLLASLAGCSASDSATASGSASPDSSGCGGPSCGLAGADPKSNYDINLPGISAGGGVGGVATTSASEVLNLCGVAAVGCNPDDEASCVHAVPVATTGGGGASSTGRLATGGGASTTASSSGSEGGASAEATSLGGTSMGASMGGTSTGDASAEATSLGGAFTGGTGTGTSLAGGTSAGTGVAPGATDLACNVVLDSSTTRSQCEVAGKLGDGQACTGRGSCAAGYACADDDGDGIGQCRHYCCAGDSVCQAGYYCAKRESLQGVGTTVKASVSVCLPSVACKFDDPYPCPAGDSCSCPSGRVCGLVRSDGVTDCVVPGSGVEGEACPCAAGHVCSTALGTCVRVCSLVDSSTNGVTCPIGACQASASLPTGVGVCVSSSSLN